MHPIWLARLGEVRPSNGLEHDSVVNVDSIATIPGELLLRPLGVLLDAQEHELTRAFYEAFDLED